MQIFILVRHFMTEWNRNNILQGHTDTPLCDEGKEAAEKFPPTLDKFDPECIICSDLQRAQQSAIPAAKYFGIEIHSDARLRECDFGAISGLDRNKAEKHFGESALAAWDSEYENYNFRKYGGESREAVLRRHLALLYNATFLPYKVILLVGHGMSMNTLLSGLNRNDRLCQKNYCLIRRKDF